MVVAQLGQLAARLESQGVGKAALGLDAGVLADLLRKATKKPDEPTLAQKHAKAANRFNAIQGKYDRTLQELKVAKEKAQKLEQLAVDLAVDLAAIRDEIAGLSLETGVPPDVSEAPADQAMQVEGETPSQDPKTLYPDDPELQEAHTKELRAREEAVKFRKDRVEIAKRRKTEKQQTAQAALAGGAWPRYWGCCGCWRWPWGWEAG